jgi:flagellar biosynthetic protein FliP
VRHAVALVALAAFAAPALAAPWPRRRRLRRRPRRGPTSAVTMVAILTLATLIPALVLSCTTFVRFVVVLGFVRTGLSTQSAPPNQVLVGLALFMTVFVSAPVAHPDVRGRRQAVPRRPRSTSARPRPTPRPRRCAASSSSAPASADLAMFYEVSELPRPATADDVPLRIAVPAFIVSELRTAFELGLTVLLPFLVIDLVVATVLTALGMVMVPPQVLSLPLKLLVFLAVDGWHLIVRSLLQGAM